MAKTKQQLDLPSIPKRVHARPTQSHPPTDLSKEVISLVKQIMPYIDFSQENRGWGDYWLKEEELHQRYIGCWEDEDEDPYEEEDCQGSRVAQTLDSPYYKIADAFLEEAEAFLSARKVGA
jgi:hypothetical protein